MRTHNTCYLLEQWRFPTGEYVTAPVPAAAVRGGHYGTQLVSYVLHQYYHAHVTPPLLLAQLHDWGVEISAGPLNYLLTEGHDAFHQEKAAVKAAGLATSTYVQADDTGARHQGRQRLLHLYRQRAVCLVCQHRVQEPGQFPGTVAGRTPL